MEYATSRRFPIPQEPNEFRKFFAFNLWQSRHWPYRELLVGDVLYWYVSSEQVLVWKSKVSKVDRFPYQSKDHVEDILLKEYGKFDLDHPHFRNAPETGYCLALRGEPLKKLMLKRPPDFQFIQLGWMRVDEKFVEKWFMRSEPESDPDLESISSQKNLFDALTEINEKMQDITPKRIRSVVNQSIRNDGRIIKALKEVAKNNCQFPGCTAEIRKKNGQLYVEVAHVQAVGKGGRSILGNLLVLCPNHHKEFDYGDLHVTEQRLDRITGILNGKRFEIDPFNIDSN